jgi:hypothetical protein
LQHGMFLQLHVRHEAHHQAETYQRHEMRQTAVHHCPPLSVICHLLCCAMLCRFMKNFKQNPPNIEADSRAVQVRERGMRHKPSSVQQPAVWLGRNPVCEAGSRHVRQDRGRAVCPCVAACS